MPRYTWKNMQRQQLNIIEIFIVSELTKMTKTGHHVKCV